MILVCWNEDPGERPTFTELLSKLEDLIPKYVNAATARQQLLDNDNALETKSEYPDNDNNPYDLPPDSSKGNYLPSGSVKDSGFLSTQNDNDYTDMKGVVSRSSSAANMRDCSTVT